jgi:hypothetical protein
MKPLLSGIACLLVLTAVARPVSAQSLSTGVRVGVSAEPDQFYFGGHIETAPLVDRITFRPNIEVGVGNDLTLVALNFDLAYKFRSKKSWNVYGFGGPALNISSADNNTETGGGFSLGVGLEDRKGLFGEIKVGLGDSPEFKFGIGYRFH